MGKPVRIHKKKSFMFTTKHHSFLGWLGVFIGVFCWAAAIILVTEAFKAEGVVSLSRGAAGFFSIILSIIGAICGLGSMREKDVFIMPAIAAMILNGVLMAAWIVFILIVTLQT